MKVLERGTMPNGTHIQIEEWNENYNFMPYGSTLATYPKSKMSHAGSFAPKGNENYRFSFEFETNEEAQTAFNDLKEGNKELSDFKMFMRDKKYIDCI